MMRNRLKEFPIGCKSEDGRLHDSVIETFTNVLTLGATGQRKAQKEAAEAQKQADLRARRIAAEQKPMEETATLGMDTGARASALGSLGLLIEPDKAKKPKGLGTSGSTGLSTTGTTAGLGFN